MVKIVPSSRSPRRQHGVALFVVLVFVMLSMLLALWASRTSLFNEMVVGNDAEYQRAFEAAQALLQDAELDIRKENSNGSACTAPDESPVCRKKYGVVQIPLEAKDVAKLLADLEGMDSNKPRCKNGLCLKRTGPQDFWNDKDAMAAMRRVGTRYGYYTGALTKTGSTTAANPILQKGQDDPSDPSPNEGGWYWIEVLPYASGSSELIADEAGNQLSLNLTPNVVYRITAVAVGLRQRSVSTPPGSTEPITMAVLQQTFARNKMKD